VVIHYEEALYQVYGMHFYLYLFMHCILEHICNSYTILSTLASCLNLTFNFAFNVLVLII